MGLLKKYFTFDEIKDFLGISKNSTEKLLKNVNSCKGYYSRDDIIKACMGDEVYERGSI